MFSLRSFMLVLAIAGVLGAEESRRELVNPAPVPGDDAKGNSDKVPDVYPILMAASDVW